MIPAQSLITKFQQALKEKWGYIWGTAGITWDAGSQRRKVLFMEQKYGRNWKDSAYAKKDDYYSSALYGDHWIGRKVSDCSGLFRWAFNQFGQYIAHGSNSIWKSYCSAQGGLSGGKRTDGNTLLPGTAVFTDRAGDKTHIGLYVGGGKVIEAAGASSGVITTSVALDKWKCWGELSGVDYVNAGNEKLKMNNEELKPEGGNGKPTLRKGSKGAAVKELQTALADLGYDLGPCGIDGDFGKATEAAVRSFQSDRGLEADGICGPLTFAELEKAAGSLKAPVKGQTYSVTVSGLDLAQAQAICSNYPGCSEMEKEVG